MCTYVFGCLDIVSYPSIEPGSTQQVVRSVFAAVFLNADNGQDIIDALTIIAIVVEYLVSIFLFRLSIDGTIRTRPAAGIRSPCLIFLLWGKSHFLDNKTNLQADFFQ